jgi:uncharacterized damage-inducible protein DinB
MKVLRSLLLLVLCPIVVHAAQQPSARPRPATTTGFRTEFFANLDEVQEKLVLLAESIPAEKFSYRPGSEVRSTSEVFMHVAGSNYFLATYIGAKAPVLAPDMEKKVTKKADVLNELRKSFVHLRGAAGALSNADLERSVRMFGTQRTTYRGVMLTMLTHLHEHLGQLIAYARLSGVVPPWSR